MGYRNYLYILSARSLGPGWADPGRSPAFALTPLILRATGASSLSQLFIRTSLPRICLGISESCNRFSHLSGDVAHLLQAQWPTPDRGPRLSLRPPGPRLKSRVPPGEGALISGGAQYKKNVSMCFFPTSPLTPCFHSSEQPSHHSCLPPHRLQTRALTRFALISLIYTLSVRFNLNPGPEPWT